MGISQRRLLALFAGTPALLTALAWLYMLGMTHLEGQPRTFWQSLGWATETFTTTGYGQDSQWSHPVMVVFVGSVQLLGVSITFIVVSLLVLPFFEARFESRIPTVAPKLRDYVLIYRWGPAVASLVEELESARVTALLIEEDDQMARRLFERGRHVVRCRLNDEDPHPSLFERARAVVANGSDEQNGAFILAAREQGYRGDIISLAQAPLHRPPMMLAGATSVYTPLHILAAAMAALTSERIGPRVTGLHHLGQHLLSAELRVDHRSELAGRTLAQANIRGRTGATVIAQWRRGEFSPHPRANDTIETGSILVAVGTRVALDALGKLATPLKREGPVVVCGHGEVGAKITELLRDAGERVVTIDHTPGDDIDVVGNVLDRSTLARAGVEQAGSVVLAMGDDSSTLFAATVVRDFASEVPIIARVNRPDNVQRIHRAGADFALSLAEVAGKLLAQKLLGTQWLSMDTRVRLVKIKAGTLAGSSPTADNIGQRTGCSILAVERAGTMLADFSQDFRLGADDDIVLCGREEIVADYLKRFVKT